MKEEITETKWYDEKYNLFYHKRYKLILDDEGKLIGKPQLIYYFVTDLNRNITQDILKEGYLKVKP